MTAASQVRHPWRATARTVAAAVIGLAPIVPEVILEARLDGTAIGAQTIATAAAVTRILALPAVDRWLRKHAPWLAAEPGAAAAVGNGGGPAGGPGPDTAGTPPA